MSTANLPPGAMPVDHLDPFLSPPTTDSQRHRYSGFDNNAFSLYSNGSPSQAKRALEAHISETERRLQEASRLGQVLINQRKELADRLQEVEGQEQEDQVSPALKTKLLDLEKEVNEVSRETARAFVGKNRVPSGEAPESTEYGGIAHQSPSKAHAPSRKQRNQQPNRVNDLKLATDISTSLLAQVRDLQASLAEKDEALKAVTIEKDHLEADLDNMRQRIRSLNESEQRYKDENWSLETQLHELTATHKDATDREQRLAQTLNVHTTQKASLERDFEDLKLNHAKLLDDHGATRKQHDAELTDLKKNATADESQITGLHKKVEELTSQNKELAQAFAYRLDAQSRNVSAESARSGEDINDGNVTPEDSPPGSPSKATPRHGALHSETTQSALNHAYRSIQNLKNQLHREKTEKMEYRKLLQEARDDMESRRGLVDSGKKRVPRGKDQELFKKPSRPDRLGDVRGSKEEIVEDDDWEDHEPAETPSKSRLAIVTDGPTGKRNSLIDTSTDAYVTATENSDAFETANERDGTTTESDAFQTGAETLDGDSDQTETEAGPSRAGARRPGHKRSQSFQSTASTSADDSFEDAELKTPVQSQHPKYKIRVSRGNQRRISGRPSSEALRAGDLEYQDSPASAASNNSTPAGQGQSLFDQLGNLSDAETEEGTPGSVGMLSPSPELTRRSPAPSRLRQSVSSDERPKLAMVDSGVMTEPWEPESKNVLAGAAGAVGAVVAGGAGYLFGHESKAAPDAEHIAERPKSEVESLHDEAPANTSRYTMSSMVSQDTEPSPVLSEFPQPPMHTTSAIMSQDSYPMEAEKASLAPIMSQSTVLSQHTEPAEAERALPAPLTQSTVISQHTAPVEPAKIALPVLSHSAVLSQHTEPVEPEPVEAVVAAPIAPVVVEAPRQPMAFSTFIRQETEPVDAPRPATAKRFVEGAAVGAGAGIFSGYLTRSKGNVTTAIAEDETSQPPRPSSRGRDMGTSTDRTPFRQINGNAPPSPERKATKDAKSGPKVAVTPTADESMQTTLSAEEIENMLRHQNVPVLADVSPFRPSSSSSGKAPVFGSTKPRRSQDSVATVERVPRRPGSSGSLRSRERTPPPPLPTQAKQVIAAAALAGGKPTSSSSMTAPVAAFGTLGTMGPPAMPASAFRNSQQFRPRTPVNNPQASPVRGIGTVSAARPNTAGRSNLGSPITRRSSVSSFASELDQRFNISSAGGDPNNSFDMHHSDPRMIQAITQTMIGEYLFKYTRKAGSENMSTTRHRRFFWVHPYTRTLYWSEQDPSTTGKMQLKSKSVQIEAVRIVSDDNPMPPGLHRKSLVVMTPGRTIKFTAPTAQRHETWFNALSYLLLKTGTERDGESMAATSEAEEFNPGSSAYARSSSRATGRSRQSVSSYMSRSTTVGTQSPQRATQQHPTLRVPSAQGQRSLSNRLSAIAGSFSSRHSKQSLHAHSEEGGGGYSEPHNPNDSAEDLRRVIEAQERDAERLENVRACCDGKHDVGSLARGGRHTHTHSHSHSKGPVQKEPAVAKEGRSSSRTSERR